MLTVSCLGCDSFPSQTGVEGKVAFQGQPIERGTIELRPIAGTAGPMVGSSIKQGKYQIDAAKGPVVGGMYRVHIIGLRASGQKMAHRDPRQDPVDVYESFLPDDYNSRSQLKVVISEEVASQLDFDLPSKAAIAPQNP